jgi:adenosylcobinamide kinase/adenosylcobinamide-phosphate guanylyltransferase
VRGLGRVGAGAARLAGRIGGLVGAWRQTRARVVAVSDEAGLGVVPATPAGRLFRDELGRLNQILAAESEEAELVVAGRVVPLGPG